jgi:hypothetical protein
MLSEWLGVAVLSTLISSLAAAQDCPTAQSGQLGFVVELGDQQKSEVFHGDDGIVRTVMRYNGKMLLETTQHEGLFQLDRLDNGRKTKSEPLLKPGAMSVQNSSQKARIKIGFRQGTIAACNTFRAQC